MVATVNPLLRWHGSFPGTPEAGVVGMGVASRRISLGMPTQPEEGSRRDAAHDPIPPHDRTADRQEPHDIGYSPSPTVSRDYG